MKLYYFKSAIPIIMSVLVSVWLHSSNSNATVTAKDKFVQQVTFETLNAVDHQVIVKAWGQLEPWQQTSLASQVAGRVEYVHPDFEIGKVVQAGTIILKLDPADYEPPVAAAAAELALAEAQYLEAMATADVARVQLRDRLDTASPLALRVPQLAAAKARVDSANAALQIAKRDLARTNVVAPYTAVIRELNVGVGQVIASGESVATLFNATKARVILPVAMYDAPFIANTMKYSSSEIRVTDTSNRNVVRTARFEGVLAYVEQRTRMQQVVAIIEDPYLVETDNGFSEARLKFGSFVEAELQGPLLQNVYAIPQHLLDDNKIWLINEEDQLQSREVEVLREEQELVYVRGKINDGERLAKTLPDYPTNGTRVKAVKSIVSTHSASGDL
ncbi:RND family efflux transporter, MFP subunit [Rheinheimera pacifica]|uniref:RND family efflux transporter, MFP subunit n=1 Tax=Rheinheimera pacifica TaxID=173990 RepID=A0A1H6MUH0_9GAMM|nr:efflux RND transporter periplasmic adaptor subunit [Rheinheimera pacifica]SEI05648.1 RND family efflux transporter, MFP subunit [Rheinheimera pacifica]